MRLINVHTYDLEYFFGTQTPKYAILSHCWGAEEVIFQEWQTNRKAAQHKAGYRKIEGACGIARDYGYQYLWCDTNCIDKSDSAELTESINSMYAWYRDSGICIAYLEDVGLERDIGPAEVDSHASSFRGSRWFTRGWTLQELIAPKKLTFFSREWRTIGTKRTIGHVVSEITRIPEDQLHNYRQDATSAAARMSWAACRETTRIEDMAYCLLGLFDINMPLLYGEGKKAFRRLQEEILKSSIDLSILAWELERGSSEPHHSLNVSSTEKPSTTETAEDHTLSLLAESPRCFLNSQSIMASRQLFDDMLLYEGFNLTGPGLFIDLPIMRSSHDGLVLARLPCSVKRNDQYLYLWIPLLIVSRRQVTTYVRSHLPASILYLPNPRPMSTPEEERCFILFHPVEEEFGFPREYSGWPILCLNNSTHRVKRFRGYLPRHKAGNFHPMCTFDNGMVWDVSTASWVEPPTGESQFNHGTNGIIHTMIIFRRTTWDLTSIQAYLVTTGESGCQREVAVILNIDRRTIYRYRGRASELIQKLVALPRLIIADPDKVTYIKGLRYILWPDHMNTPALQRIFGSSADETLGRALYKFHKEHAGIIVPELRELFDGVDTATPIMIILYAASPRKSQDLSDKYKGRVVAKYVPGWKPEGPGYNLETHEL